MNPTLSSLHMSNCKTYSSMKTQKIHLMSNTLKKTSNFLHSSSTHSNLCHSQKGWRLATKSLRAKEREIRKRSNATTMSLYLNYTSEMKSSQQSKMDGWAQSKLSWQWLTRSLICLTTTFLNNWWRKQQDRKSPRNSTCTTITSRHSWSNAQMWRQLTTQSISSLSYWNQAS